jgi:hypothetical protein
MRVVQCPVCGGIVLRKGLAITGSNCIAEYAYYHPALQCDTLYFRSNKFILGLHDDKGGKFIGIKWDASFAQHGIWREHTVKAPPQQDGVAERLNRTLEELLVAMLNSVCLPTHVWGKGLNYLRHVIVRSPSSSIPTSRTPWYNMTAHMQGKVWGVPVVSYCKSATRLSSCGRGRAPAFSREPSAGPSNTTPPIPNVKEEAAPDIPHKPPANKDNNNNLYPQPQARLARRLALHGVAELPADVRALFAQSLRSIYNEDNKYIELPEAMGHAFRAAIDTKAVLSDAEPKTYRNAMHRRDSELWHQAVMRKMEAHLENSMWELVKRHPGARPFPPSGSSRSSTTPTAPASTTRPASLPRALVNIPESTSMRCLLPRPSGLLSTTFLHLPPSRTLS